jgi:hypothetical protein
VMDIYDRPAHNYYPKKKVHTKINSTCILRSHTRKPHVASPKATTAMKTLRMSHLCSYLQRSLWSVRHCHCRAIFVDRSTSGEHTKKVLLPLLTSVTVRSLAATVPAAEDPRLATPKPARLRSACPRFSSNSIPAVRSSFRGSDPPGGYRGRGVVTN